jgi:hypothetical protein
MNASVVAVMHEAGKAINDTFKLHNAGAATAQSGPCSAGVAVIDVSGQFDYVVTMEDLSRGQRIGNYSIEFRRKNSTQGETLVPAVQPAAPSTRHKVGDERLRSRDRPDGHDPRDQYIGHKRIDLPIVQTSGPGAIAIAQVRFNCLRVVKSLHESSIVYVRSFSVHKKRVPWE